MDLFLQQYVRHNGSSLLWQPPPTSGNVMGKSAFCGGCFTRKMHFLIYLIHYRRSSKIYQDSHPAFLFLEEIANFVGFFAYFSIFLPHLFFDASSYENVASAALPCRERYFRCSLLVFHRKTGILGSRIPSPCGVFRRNDTMRMRERRSTSPPPDGGLPGLSGTGPLRHAGPLAGADARCP